MFDKNELLNKFSDTFFLKKEEMHQYFKENNFNDFNSTYEEFKLMRKRTFDYLWEYTNPNIILKDKEIIHLTENFLKENYSWINDKGIASVNNHINWMCWQDGILK